MFKLAAPVFRPSAAQLYELIQKVLYDSHLDVGMSVSLHFISSSVVD